MILFDKWNSETIWGATNADPYWMASLTMPQLNTDLDGSYSARSMFVPTLDVVETYYTKNGVPIDEDPEFAYDNRYEVRQKPLAMKNGRSEKANIRHVYISIVNPGFMLPSDLTGECGSETEEPT